MTPDFYGYQHRSVLLSPIIPSDQLVMTCGLKPVIMTRDAWLQGVPHYFCLPIEVRRKKYCIE
jgi:dihydroorotase